VFYNNVVTKKNAFSDQTLSIFSGQNACVRDRDYHSDRYTHTLQSFGYYQKTFNERCVLNTAILWMATSQKQVTNRLYIAVFVRRSSLGPLLWKCICSHELAQTLSSSGDKPKMWVCYLL